MCLCSLSFAFGAFGLRSVIVEFPGLDTHLLRNILLYHEIRTNTKRKLLLLTFLFCVCSSVQQNHPP